MGKAVFFVAMQGVVTMYLLNNYFIEMSVRYYKKIDRFILV